MRRVRLEGCTVFVSFKRADWLLGESIAGCRDAMDAFTQADLSGEFADKVSAFYVGLIPNLASSGKMVPRDRIELSTPAFSVHQQNEQKQQLATKGRCKK